MFMSFEKQDKNNSIERSIGIDENTCAFLELIKAEMLNVNDIEWGRLTRVRNPKPLQV